MAVQIYAGVPGAVDGIIAGNVGQQTEGRAAVSVRVKGSLQVGKSPPQAATLATVQGLSLIHIWKTRSSPATER